MIFGGFRGLGADRSRHHMVYALFVTLSVFCLLGFMFGFLDGLPELGRPLFLWDLARILYFLGALTGFAVCILAALKYEDSETRIGAIGFAALPLFVVLVVAGRSFGLW
jgi:hypothetical protein